MEATTITGLFDKLGDVTTGLFGMVSDVATAIVANPLLLIGIGVAFVGLAIGLFRKFI